MLFFFFIKLKENYKTIYLNKFFSLKINRVVIKKNLFYHVYHVSDVYIIVTDNLLIITL